MTSRVIVVKLIKLITIKKINHKNLKLNASMICYMIYEKPNRNITEKWNETRKRYRKSRFALPVAISRTWTWCLSFPFWFLPQSRKVCANPIVLYVNFNIYLYIYLHIHIYILILLWGDVVVLVTNCIYDYYQKYHL